MSLGKKYFSTLFQPKVEAETSLYSYIVLLRPELKCIVFKFSLIGSNVWLVTQKVNVRGHFFSFLPFAFENRRKHIFLSEASSSIDISN